MPKIHVPKRSLPRPLRNSVATRLVNIIGTGLVLAMLFFLVRITPRSPVGFIFVCGILFLGWAQHRRSSNQVAPEEDREAFIGRANAIVAAAALALNMVLGFFDAVVMLKNPHHDSRYLAPLRAMSVLAIAGIALGVTGWILARRRVCERQAFLLAAQGGAIDGILVRVDGERKLVVRRTAIAESYRVADVEETIFEYIDVPAEPLHAKQPAERTNG